MKSTFFKHAKPPQNPYRFRIFILGLAILFCTQVSGQQNLKVLTFNIWDPNDIPFWEKCGGFPVDSIVNYLSEDHADILLLQEVSLENNQKNQTYNRLKAALEAKGYYYSAYYRPNYTTGQGDVGYYDGMSNSGYPLAILSKYPILETFAGQSNDKVIMSKGVLGIKIRFNEKPLYIFNTHLTIGAKGTNAEISKVALPFINRITGDSAVIFGGDFNAPSAFDFPNSEMTFGKYTYSSETDQFLWDDEFTDAYAKARKNGRDIVADATCPGQDDYIKRVDRIYTRNTKLKPVNALVKHNPWAYCNKVDHLAVFIEFQL
jgi:endonuclease/exonuclease/phosphatase family metal-dependent hydrolase